MNKKLNLLVVLVSVLALGSVLIACPTDSGGGGGGDNSNSGGNNNTGGGGGDDGVPKSLTISGITISGLLKIYISKPVSKAESQEFFNEFYLTEMLGSGLTSKQKNMLPAWGEGTISNGSVTVSLKKTTDNSDWTGIGDYLVFFFHGSDFYGPKVQDSPTPTTINSALTTVNFSDYVD
jgi:hypothetical protein